MKPKAPTVLKPKRRKRRWWKKPAHLAGTSSTGSSKKSIAGARLVLTQEGELAILLKDVLPLLERP